MPTRTISEDGADLLITEDHAGDPGLLISGSNNRVRIFPTSEITSVSGGPAIVISGAGNHLRIDSYTVSSSGAVAIQGSEFRDEIVNYMASVTGNILLGGGNDWYQSNYDGRVHGGVYGGEGDDALGTFEGMYAVRFFGDAGKDSLFGGSKADHLDGGSDNDRLEGGGGEDELVGGSGADSFSGGAGNDSLNGGGDEGDIAHYAGYRAGYTLSVSSGAGTVADSDTGDGDDGTDTIAGIHVFRFRDEQIDTRIAVNKLVVDGANGPVVNTTDRYGYNPVELRGEGVVFENRAHILGTALPHTAVQPPYGMMAVDSGALALGAYNATVTNAAGASITGIADAIGVIARPADRAGDGLRVVNHGLIRSLEEDAIDVDMLTLTNGATGVIDAAYGHVLARGSALATRNGNMIVDNAGIIRASDSAFAANQLLLTNSGTVIGRIDVGLYSRLENSGSITGAYHVWGGLTLINHSQSSGNLAIDVDPVAAQYSNGYTYTSIDNRGTFAGDITISGRTAFITAPAAHADYIALIVNSGTITGSIVSDAAFAPLAGGGSPDASFVEDVANSGTITGDVRLGDGADRLVNSGTIGGSVEGGGGDDQLRGGGAADRLDGGDGDDILEGGGHNDLLRSGAGKDRLDGGVGNDVLFYGATFDADDRADGGAGTDTLVLQGNYPALVLGALSAVGIEGISLQSGTIIRWGDAGESSYDYRLTLAQETAAPGQQLRINAQSLVAGEDLVLDGSAETDGGRLLVYGGFGADDLTGGAAGDIFYFESGRFGPGDRVRGGAGNDALVISGAPAGDGPLQLEIAEGVLSGIESLSFNGRFASDPDSLPSYEAVLRNGNIAPGATLIVNASSLAASQSLALDASTVADGILRIFGGAGGDSLTGGAKADRISAAGGDDLIVGGGLGDAIDGGAGADTFRYLSVADSAGAACDLISGFESGLDRIDLSAIDANLAADGNQAFAFVGTAAFSNKAGELRAAWDAATGSWAIQGDLNGDGRVDFQLYVATGGAAPLASDFVL